MQFNPSTSAQSLVARLNRTCSTDNVIYPLVDKANDMNDALDRFFYLAMTADGSWEMDDNNQTTLPIATANLNSGQQDYRLRTDMMIIEKILAKASNGLWQELRPTDITMSRKNRHAQNIIELPTNNVGSPTHYDKDGLSIFLDPIPNYTAVAGLKIMFQRGPSYFESGDTTKQPGIPILFHNYIYRYAALQYLIDKPSVPERKVARVQQQVERDEQAIVDFYANRSLDEPTAISFIHRSSR